MNTKEQRFWICMICYFLSRIIEIDSLLTATTPMVLIIALLYFYISMMFGKDKA